MTSVDLSAHRQATRRIKLDTLIGIRWIAVAGQTAAILTVGLGLGFPMPVGLCFAVVALSAWLNLFLKLRYPSSQLLRDTPAALLLGYDVLQLGVLLYLTGGLQNPFALLIIVPVIISAATLSFRHTVSLGALTLAVISLLWWFHEPLPWPAGEMAPQPPLYIGGMWGAIICTMVFAGVYAYRVAREARQLSAALAATELVLEREHHLSALDGLAAAAAHELGTPLATITVVARELQKSAPPGSSQAEDLALLVSQSQRCREILGRLTSLGNAGDWTQGEQPLTHLVAEAIEPYAAGDKRIVLAEGNRIGPEPVRPRNPAILYGIGNIIENAVDFAETTVTITTAWTADKVMIEIADDGPGFAAEIRDRIGEPYVTTRGGQQGMPRPADVEAGGLGLGYFIAKTFLERSGARLSMTNRPSPAHGAVVRMTWPRFLYEERRGPAGTEKAGQEGDAPYKPEAPAQGAVALSN
ncbi:MAG: ActS/PrrB/RegB family redox-sensitive histidine kinase [Bauldia sp.]|nr:ActS/PrrB/RegB family redox-sensitive histidine kinase [Bauldia sp.]